MKRLCFALGIGVFLVALAGCDPGFSYVIPNARTTQHDYVVDIGNGIEARFNADVFTIHGHVHVQVINQSDALIEFRYAPAEITYGRGQPVHEKRCEEFSDEPIAIRRGMMIAMSCGFVVRELGPISYSSDYRFLHVELPGFSRNGQPLKIAATMEWKD